MMHQASSLFGLAALVLTLMGPGTGSIARAQDVEPASQLSNQLAAFISVPFQSNDDGDIAPVEDDWLVGDAEPSGQPVPNPDDDLDSLGIAPDAEAPLQDDEALGSMGLSSRQPALVSWSFTGADKEVDATSAPPFLVDLSPDTQTFSADAETAYGAPDEKSAEPHDFQISKSLKVKAQPLAGGLGGRVTLTFSFPTGY